MVPTSGRIVILFLAASFACAAQETPLDRVPDGGLIRETRKLWWKKETRREALSKLMYLSDFVALVSVVEPPIGMWGSAPIQTAGNGGTTIDLSDYWQNSAIRVKVIEVFKGRYDSDSPVIALRVPMDRELGLAPYAKGSRLLVFLQDNRVREGLGKTGFDNAPVHLLAFHPWLSCQPYNAEIEDELAEVLRTGPQIPASNSPSRP